MRYAQIISVALISILLFFSLHLLLQIDSPISRRIKNYENIDGAISRIKKPYTEIKNENLLNWDSSHYHNISENGYVQGYTYLFAFFPLFPLVWNASGLSAVGIVIFNYFIFAISLTLIWYYFSDKRKIPLLILLLNMPFIAPFIIPYTESLFFLGITLSLIGYRKNNYLLYFIGALITATTRSAITIILLAFIVTELLFMINSRSIRSTLKQFALAVIPLLISTFMVLFYQKLSGAESLFTYIDAIKTWDRSFRIPSVIGDWSAEGFGLNIATILIVLPICILIVASHVFQSFGSNVTLPFIKNDQNDKDQYLGALSSIYALGAFATIFFFQNGSLNGTFRYVLCTPFFFYTLIFIDNMTDKISKSDRLYYFSAAFTLCILAFSLLQYSSGYTFSYFGFLMFFISAIVAQLTDRISSTLHYVLFGLLLLLNIFWNTYMFNCFLSNSWIFT